jgi:SAM-dependent methyltransferase
MSHKCILCGHTTSTIHHGKFGDFHRCHHCDFTSKDQGSYISEAQELDIYNSHKNSIEDKAYVDYFKSFLKDSIFSFEATGKSGFDFGSGPCPVLAQILENDYGYTMDIYDLFYAPEKTYQNKTYDLITCTEVIEHLKDPRPYFKLFSDLLKEDGLLGVMTLFHPKDDQAFLNWHYIRDRSHISFYTPRTLALLASQVGLKVIHTNHKRYITFAKKSSSYPQLVE